MAILNPQANAPIVYTLRTAPEPVVSQFGGEQYKYSLQGGNMAYVPPIVEKKRVALGLDIREPFRVTKSSESGRVCWLVEKAGEAPVARPEPQTIQQIASPNGSLSPQITTPTVVSAERDELPIRHTFMSKVMAGCYIAAIDALDEASRYAAAKNHVLKFSEESIQASANSIFIQYWKHIEQQQRYGTVQAPTHVSGGEKWHQ